MSGSSKRFLVVASVALNVAFAGAWLACAVPAQLKSSAAVGPAASSDGVWCPLHRELKVSSEQWREIEPRLREFRRAAEDVSQHIGELRVELLDLIAAPETNREAIAVKQAEIQSGQRQMQELVIGQLLAEKEILTPEQRTQLFALMREQSGCRRSGPLLLEQRPSGPGCVLKGEAGDHQQ